MGFDNDDQWRTEEVVRGVRIPPLACDVRNKRVRMRQNVVFSTKNTENFLVRGQPPPQTLPPVGRGNTPSPYPPLSAPAEPRPLPFKNPGYATDDDHKQ